jgi:Ca2+-binding EF-hand superfamily protein
MIRIGALAFSLCLLASAGLAQTVQSPTEPVNQRFLARITPGATLNRFVESLRQEFRQLDADLDGDLTTADADLHENVGRAQMRAAFAMTIMRADLNGDGMVTQGELRQTLRYEKRVNVGADSAASLEAVEAEVRRLMAADRDGDGRISYAEAYGAAEVGPINRVQAANPLAIQVRQLVAADADGDGRVTFAEFEAVGTALFRKVDADGNGTISQDELNEFRRLEAEAAQGLRTTAARAECAMPKASDAAAVVVLSVQKSEAISAVALGSQDVKTGTGEIRVEPGEGPLYVVAISVEPTIWRVTGETDRVERLVAFGGTTGPGAGTVTISTSGRTTAIPGQQMSPAQRLVMSTPLAGVTGIAPDRVSFLASPNCLRFFSEARSSDAAIVLASIRRDSGKEPAVVAARTNVAAFSVPSGKTRSAYEDKKQPRLVIQKEFGNLTLAGDASGVVVRTGPTDLESDLEQFSPGGVIEIDAATVIGSVPAVRYDVLPGAAGLLQLLNAGALTRNSRGEFLIHQKIHLPAGLSGLSASFLLLRGVPAPDGRPDGAKVISEETGQPVKFERQ